MKQSQGWPTSGRVVSHRAGGYQAWHRQVPVEAQESDAGALAAEDQQHPGAPDAGRAGALPTSAALPAGEDGERALPQASRAPARGGAGDLGWKLFGCRRTAESPLFGGCKGSPAAKPCFLAQLEVGCPRIHTPHPTQPHTPPHTPHPTPRTPHPAPHTPHPHPPHSHDAGPAGEFEGGRRDLGPALHPAAAGLRAAAELREGGGGKKVGVVWGCGGRGGLGERGGFGGWAVWGLGGGVVGE